MLYFMKPLPEGTIDTSEWNPFIKNQWFRNHFMYFVYCFQVVLVMFSSIYGVWNFSDVLLNAENEQADIRGGWGIHTADYGGETDSNVKSRF